MKIKKIIAVLGLSLLFGAISMQARMSDAEVLQYVNQGITQGKDYNTIGAELLARGVTVEQIQRLKSQYESGALGGLGSSQSGNQNNYVRGETSDKPLEVSRAHNPTGTREGTANGSVSASDSLLMNAGSLNNPFAAIRIPEVYGQNVFSSEALTFAPSTNLATPKNYTLGPGDEVMIDIWGENEEHIRQTISPEGTIMIASLGPISLNGKTIQEANNQVRAAFSRKFAGVNTDRSDISLNLGEVRSISIDVMGEVLNPGTFQVSPFSTVFNALYNAGGLSDIGSLRNIEVLRNGRKIATVDVYDYLFKGKQTGNVRLQEGDVIVVPAYGDIVAIEGNVKRPMKYEIKPGESVNNLLQYAGGFTGDAYSDMVRLLRKDGRQNELVNVEKTDFSTYRLRNGDTVTVGTVSDRYTNRVEVKGSVLRPGQYALGTNIFTVRDLINAAEGLEDDAYTGRAMLYREGPDKVLEVEGIDLGAIMAGTAPDIELRRNDQLIVSSTSVVKSSSKVEIQGMVKNPGEYAYAENLTVEDLIVMAGGLNLGASTARVEVSRRIVDPTSVEATNQLSEVFSVSIENGLLAEGQGFQLKPYDIVIVFSSPGYTQQSYVSVNGEVAFSGYYVLQNKNERLSQVIQRAGGVTQDAYLRGATLIRTISPDESTRRKEMKRFAEMSTGRDSVSVNKIQLADEYRVGIELDKALANPGSEYDIVLRPKDKVYIPQQTSTVSIAGEVMFPNTVTYSNGKKVKDYINMAGGYSNEANKGKVFVVYLNGMVKKAKRGTVVEPGCQIIVPTKKRGQKLSVGEIMAMVSSFSSLGVMAASVANLIKK